MFHRVGRVHAEPVLLDEYEHTAFAIREKSTVSLSLQLDEFQTLRSVSMWELRDDEFVERRKRAVGQRLSQSIPVQEWKLHHALKQWKIPAGLIRKIDKRFREVRESLGDFYLRLDS